MSIEPSATAWPPPDVAEALRDFWAVYETKPIDTRTLVDEIERVARGAIRISQQGAS